MAISPRIAILPLVIAIVAVSFALSPRPAAAEDAPDTLVLGTVTPPVAGQRVGVSINGIACQVQFGTGITGSDPAKGPGDYGLVLKNCQGGRATITLDGAATSTQFDLAPGHTYRNINVAPSSGFKAFAIMVARD
jgi:hypothetical protein